MLFVLPQAFVYISSSKESKACSSDAWNRNPHERQRDVDSKRLAQHCILRPVLGTEAQLLQDDLLFMDVQIVGASRSTMDGFFTSRAQNTTSVLLIWPSLQKLAPRSWTGRPDYREAQVQLSSLSSSCSELQENQEIDSGVISKLRLVKLYPRMRDSHLGLGTTGRTMEKHRSQLVGDNISLLQAAHLGATRCLRPPHCMHFA